MFLLSSLFALTLCYWISALVAQALFTSDEERDLPAAVRAGLGFIASVLYFSAAWQWMSIREAWILGLVLFAMYSAPALAARSTGDRVAAVRRAFEEHARGYLACLLGALVFFSPLILSRNYGPFTEGGGDITIYADGTHYLTERHLTSRGVPPPTSLSEFLRTLREATRSDLDPQFRAKSGAERLADSDPALLNPPAAENAIYRLMLSQLTSPFPYPPYGEFYFLDNGTNYAIYFGVQAFLYGILVVSAFYAFRKAMLAVRLLFLGLIVASHSLVSVFYNMYATHAQALAVCALVLPALYTIRPFSKAGARVYGTATAYLWMAYVHFLSIVGPLFLVALAYARRGEAVRTVPGPGSRKAPMWARLARSAAIVVAMLLVTLMLASAAQKTIAFVFGLMRGRLIGDKNWFMGDQVPVFSWHWFSFLFGAVSQQHYLPFAGMPTWDYQSVQLGIVIGMAALVLGFCIMLKIALARNAGGDSTSRSYLVMYAVSIVAVAIHLWWAQTYVYTQAKGAQNVLIIFYAAMVLPLAAGLRHRERREGRAIGVAIALLAAILLSFAATLLITRAVYGWKMAFGLDRAGILEPSFFSEADRVRREDPDAFVLFEPRKSADLYLSIQPFFGGKMVSTRHLSLLMINVRVGMSAPYRAEASDLIVSSDIPHLWILAAFPDDTRGHSRYTWKAQRLADRTSPAILLSSDDYQRDFGRKPRSADPRDTGMFSYLRNGSATLYMPPGDAAEVEVKLAPREPKQYAQMVQEVSTSLGKGLFGPSAVMEQDGAFVTLKSRLATRRTPELVRIARFSGEYWLNVRLDGKEIASNAGGDEKLSGSLVVRRDGALRITATWSNVASPDGQDWIGVFPVGGDDGSRLAFKVTGGQKQGSLVLDVPPRGVPDQYELRLYRAGGWNLITTSAPLAPQAARPR